MSNSRRWREFITWFNDIEPKSYETTYALHSEISRRIKEIKEAKKEG